MEAREFAQMVKCIRELESAMGTTRKAVVEEEQETVFVQRRGLYASRAVRAGQAFEAVDIVALRPALGLAPKYADLLVGKTAKIDLPKGTPLRWEHF